MNEFSALLSSRNIDSVNDLAYEEDFDDSDDINDGYYEEAEAEYDLPQSSSPQFNQDDEAFLDEYTASPAEGYESTDAYLEKELDANIQERMRSSPSAFVNLNLNVDMNMENDLLEEELSMEEKEEDEYTVPDVVPDSGLSAREVVMLGK